MNKITISAACMIATMLCWCPAMAADDDLSTETVTEPPITPGEGPEPEGTPPEPYEPPEPTDPRPIEGNVEPLPAEPKAPPPDIFNDVSKQIRKQESKGNVGQ